MMKKIVVLASGSGSNFQAIIDAVHEKDEKKLQIKNAEVSMLISSNENAYANERAKKNKIPVQVISDGSEILPLLLSINPDLIILAGYMRIIPSEVVKQFKKKIINIHPSLIPKHSGLGYYGIKVHESVLKSGDKETGATVHFVDEEVDTGEIILQKKVHALKNDTPEILQKRVLEVEHKILPMATEKILNSN